MRLKLFPLAPLIAIASAQSPSLATLLTSTPDLSSLASLVETLPSLLSTLAVAKNVTLLAPSNDAISKLLQSPAGAPFKANDTETIQSILTYHVLNGSFPAAEIPTSPAFVPSILNSARFTNVTGGQSVEVVKAGQNVVFTSGLLQQSTVTKADVPFAGGIVHIIDTVLTVPGNASATATAAGLTSLAKALTATDLINPVDVLSDVTIFAPNNAAFQAIAATASALSTDELANILEYHVVNGTIGYSSLLQNHTKLISLSGKPLTITLEGDTIFVDSAKVVTPNVLVANGVVHVIDNVLNPNMTNLLPNPVLASQPAAFPNGTITVGSNSSQTSGGGQSGTSAGGGTAEASNDGEKLGGMGSIGLVALFALRCFVLVG